MSGCSDKRFENMLYAYEIGILTSDERQELELHLLECEHCMGEVRQFEDTTSLIRHDPDVRDSIEDFVNKKSQRLKAAIQKEAPTPRRRSVWTTLVPTSVAAVVALLFLLAKDWQFDIRPSHEAIAVENRLAIMYFENLADSEESPRLGEIICNLLITDLSESRYVETVSSQRLYDILRLLDKEETSAIDKRLATQVAEKARARWMLMGSVLQVEPELVLTFQLIDVKTGNAVASQRMEGNRGEDLFSLVDSLSARIKNDMPLPLEAKHEVDRPIADVTTHSPLAYRYYLEGMANYYRYYNQEAVESFEKALEVDSTFAMAYYYLSLIKDHNLISTAVQFADNASRKERFFIRSRQAAVAGDIDLAISELKEAIKHYPDEKEAYYQLGNFYYRQHRFDEAIGYFQRAVEIDPLYKTVYNSLAYAFDKLGNVEQSIQAIDMYISLVPEEANPYDSRGDIYFNNGLLDSAASSYSKALEIRPSFYTSLHSLGRIYVLKREFIKADSCFRKLSVCENYNWRIAGLLSLAYVPLSQGRFDEAIRRMNEGSRTSQADVEGRDYPSFYHLKAIAYEEKGDLAVALQEIEESIRVNHLRHPDDRVYNQHFLIQLLAQTGDIERAELVSRDFKESLGTLGEVPCYWYAVALIEQAKGNLEQAVSLFEKAADDSSSFYSPIHIGLAQACIESGRWTEAIRELEKLTRLDAKTALYWGSWTAKAHYYLGVAQEGLGHPDTAAEEYQVFLELWKEADPDLKEIGDARERLTRLQSEL